MATVSHGRDNHGGGRGLLDVMKQFLVLVLNVGQGSERLVL